jgi:Aspartyl protease/Domain of unknown function (DUF4124)
VRVSERTCILSVTLLVWLLLPTGHSLWPPGAHAQVYRWIDENGDTHFTTGLTSVPERYRKSAELFAVPRPESAPIQDPSPTSPPEATRISFNPGRQILVAARLNGRGPITLVLDTGADASVVSYDALARLGIDWSGGRTGIIHGVTGSAYARSVSLESLEVGSARVGPLTVVVHDAGLSDSDGLLGRDFLNHFHVTIDNASGMVTLTRR